RVGHVDVGCPGSRTVPKHPFLMSSLLADDRWRRLLIGTEQFVRVLFDEILAVVFLFVTALTTARPHRPHHRSACPHTAATGAAARDSGVVTSRGAGSRRDGAAGRTTVDRAAAAWAEPTGPRTRAAVRPTTVDRAAATWAEPTGPRTRAAVRPTTVRCGAPVKTVIGGSYAGSAAARAETGGRRTGHPAAESRRARVDRWGRVTGLRGVVIGGGESGVVRGVRVIRRG